MGNTQRYHQIQLSISLLFYLVELDGFGASDAFSFQPTNLKHTHGGEPSSSTSCLYSSLKEQGIGVGIDLGTTNSAISFLDEDAPKIIEIPNNGRTMKSVVAYENDDEALVGLDAIHWESKSKKSAYRHVKRIMGTGADYIPKEILDVVPHVVATRQIEQNSKKKKKKKKPSLEKILENAKENPTMLSSLIPRSKKMDLVAPESVSASILRKLLDVARDYTKQKITRAVIGVPAYFNDAQREATIAAANLAGVEKVKLLREPEAAALAYGIDKGQEEEELVLVFDLGGGTYDVSILLIERGLTEVVCTSGNSQLGGSNFDAKIAKHLSQMLNGAGRSEGCSDIILLAAEAIRIYLSNNRSVQLALPLTDDGWLALNSPSSVILTSPFEGDKPFEAGSQSATHLFHEMSRNDMERLVLAELQLLLRPIREVAIMAGALLPGDARPSIVEASLEIDSSFSEEEDFYNTQDEDELNLGSNQAVNSALEEMDFKATKKAQQKGRQKARKVAKKERKYREESRKANDVQPDAKIRGDGISGRPISRLVLVGGATRMPAIGRLLTAVTGCASQKTVDPDEAVAIGCAVHAGVLDGNEDMGTVLNPMQAAILRAVIEKERREGGLDDIMFDDEDEFGDYEEIVF
jgi:molecular chaperone DnaK (HSP70)